MELRKQNILSFLEEKTNLYADRIALGMRTQLGWKEFTYQGVGLLSRKLAYYMINTLQVKKGEKLTILSESKPEFGACVFASILAGMVTVPLDNKLTKYELHSILSDCEPVVMLVSQSCAATALELQKELPSLKYILVIDEPSYNSDLTSIYELPNNYEGKWRHRASKSTALIIYTSGTTGKPKGVEITFRNMFAQLSDLQVALDVILPNRHITVLSILPMNHLFELTVGFSTFLNIGFSVYYTQSLKPKDILSVMRDKQVEFMIVVPAFLKLLKTSIENELANSSGISQVLFKIMYNAAKFIPCYTLKKIMFGKIHDKFGGHFEGCISGGAPLDTGVGKFFETIGIKVYQGYGLSEASPVVSINTDKRSVLASVGRPLSSLTAKTDPQTGELLLKGPSVMKGYHNQPEMTAEVIDQDGWLHTGDVAEIDKDGHIFITGRIKNMIVLSGGKKVLPEEVETALEQSPYFAEVCVLGVSRSGGAKDGTEDIAAVIVPHAQLYEQYDEQTLEKLVRSEVKTLSQRLTSYKRPINIIINKEPLPRTSTRKVKRKEVKELITV
ncbi:MAG: AMP-binding protein [Heliobacteriaceae bacterium]|jgi:long-chain acyl-CoA synthetase|nr:AMP-binding protein [Heliobacteriaceae bacterium]